MLNIILLAFLLSLLIAYLVTPLIRSVALRFNIIDYPDGTLKLHFQPTPYLGGLAVYLAFLISIGAAIFLAEETAIETAKITGIALGGTIVLLLGLVDDLRKLSPKLRLVVEACAAFILVLFGVRLTLVFFNYYLNIFFTIFWVVAIANAFNIIDTFEGMSAGVTFIASIIFFLIAFQTANAFLAIAYAGLAGAVLGFLRYNFKPGTIFLGDAGSLFLGFIIASLAVEINYSYLSWSWVAFLSPLLILGVPIYDTLLVMILRYKKGEPLLHGSRDHLAFSRKEVVLIIYLIALSLGLTALIVINVNTILGVLVFSAVLLTSITMGRVLSKLPGLKYGTH